MTYICTVNFLIFLKDIDNFGVYVLYKHNTHFYFWCYHAIYPFCLLFLIYFIIPEHRNIMVTQTPLWLTHCRGRANIPVLKHHLIKFKDLFAYSTNVKRLFTLAIICNLNAPKETSMSQYYYVLPYTRFYVPF